MRSNHAIFDSIWFPFTYQTDIIENPPVIIERGDGIYLFDRQGNSYIDAISSWWVNILGHNHPAITEAVHRQLDKLEHVLMAGMIADTTITCAERLKEMLPPQLTRIFFSDNGSTAVEVALKIALQYFYLKGKDRTKFIALGGAYHGDTLGAMSVGGITQYHGIFHKLFQKQLFTDPPNCFQCPVSRNKDTCAAECMDSLQRLLMEHSDTIAACIFEPMVQGAAGMRIYPVKVLHRLFSLCKEFGIVTIADEIAMGFGRTGKRFACEHAGAVPDIMCLSKGLTGGYLPMAATVVKDHIYQEFAGSFPSEHILYHGHSFTGNPLAASAAAATLEIILKKNIPDSLQGTFSYFRNKLHLFDTLPFVAETGIVILLSGFSLFLNNETRKKCVHQKIQKTLLEPVQKNTFLHAKK